MKTRDQACGQPYGQTHPVRNRGMDADAPSPDMDVTKPRISLGVANADRKGVFKHRPFRVERIVARARVAGNRARVQQWAGPHLRHARPLIGCAFDHVLYVNCMRQPNGLRQSENGDGADGKKRVGGPRRMA